MTDDAGLLPPLPRPTPLSRPFWEAALRHQLVLQHCRSCSRYLFYPRYNCPSCFARSLDWAPASGKGTVYSYTVARRPTHPAFASRVPYVIAIVELEEGPHMTTNIVDCDPDSVFIGMPVEVRYVDATPEVSLVVFGPASAGPTEARDARQRPV